jgi:hypothetical protein
MLTLKKITHWMAGCSICYTVYTNGLQKNVHLNRLITLSVIPLSCILTIIMFKKKYYKMFLEGIVCTV